MSIRQWFTRTFDLRKKAEWKESCPLCTQGYPVNSLGFHYPNGGGLHFIEHTPCKRWKR